MSFKTTKYNGRNLEVFMIDHERQEKELKSIKDICNRYIDDYDSLKHNESLGKEYLTGKARHDCNGTAEFAKEILGEIQEDLTHEQVMKEIGNNRRDT